MRRQSTESGETDVRGVAAILRERFGFDAFRPGQAEVVEAVLGGEAVLAVMPTGAGKSLCYQLPALAGEGVTLVLSPLIALMKDQVDSLHARGIPATFINSHVSYEERAERLEATRRGEVRLLYVAPERLAAPGFVEQLRTAPITRIAVDEAHCVSQWGHDFRPDYLEIAKVAEVLQVSQICAFTATATPEVREDITRALRMHNPRLVVHGFQRPNLRFSVVAVTKMREKLAHIQALAAAYSGQSGIVYCATRKKVEAVSQALEQAGMAVGRYHGGLDEAARSTMQERFMAGELKVMVATNAFGMGIDKSDIRFVAHHDMPGSLEAYYQEAGRAGRDDAPAECVILFNYIDLRIHEFFIERIGDEAEDKGRGNGQNNGPNKKRPPTPEQVAALQRLERAKLRRMVSYCYAEHCRQHVLLSYFGDPEATECGRCDRCDDAQGQEQPTWATRGGRGAVPAKAMKVKLLAEAAPSDEQAVLMQKVLSAFARARGRVSFRRVVALLRGVSSDLPEGLGGSRSDGLLANDSAEHLEALVQELAACGALRAAGGDAQTLALTSHGVEVMHRRETPPLRWPLGLGGASAKRRRAKGKGKPKTKGKTKTRVSAGREGGDVDEALHERLLLKRRELAEEHGVPAYVVASNALISLLSEEQPKDLVELASVKGIGPARLMRFGDALLAALHGEE
ncbi:MAG: RecQ family ATP-dependent DNA helicase [Deltaproteobacteria bacterium]|nr:RecQ family ATP-dependent DNA helicase [Deltaproteobacteria bacterium]